MFCPDDIHEFVFNGRLPNMTPMILKRVLIKHSKPFVLTHTGLKLENGKGVFVQFPYLLKDVNGGSIKYIEEKYRQTGEWIAENSAGFLVADSSVGGSEFFERYICSVNRLTCCRGRRLFISLLYRILEKAVRSYTGKNVRDANTALIFGPDREVNIYSACLRI